MPRAESIEAEERRWMALAGAGDDGALQHLIDRHAASVMEWLRARSVPHDTAEQLALDVFWPTRLANFNGTSAPRTYLIGVAKQLWRHHRRSTERDKTRSAASLDGLTDTGQEPRDDRPNTAVAVALADLTNHMCDTLTDREAAIIQMRYTEDRTFAEIADRLGLAGADTAKTIHRRALLRLRDAFAGGPNDPMAD